MQRQRSALAKIIGGNLLIGLLALWLIIGSGLAQETTFPSLIGEWNHIESAQSITVRKNGDVWQTRGPQARVQSGVIDHGGDFAFEGKDNAGRPYRCVYKINFLADGKTNWRNVFHSGSWTCPSGVYTRIAGTLVAEPRLVLTFQGKEGGPFTPYDLSVRLVAEGYRLGWRMEGNGSNWLDITPTKGEVPSEGSTEVKINVRSSARTFKPGTYDAIITFEGEQVGVVERTIRLIVAPAPETMSLQTPQAPQSSSDQAITDARLNESIKRLDALLGPARGRVRVGIHGGNRVKLGQQYRLEAEATIDGVPRQLDVDRVYGAERPWRAVVSGLRTPA
jgi:hypothetical protein